MKLRVDLRDFIQDKDILARIELFEQKQQITTSEYIVNSSKEDQARNKAYNRNFITYSEGGFFGDNDILCYLQDHSNNNLRDSTAIGALPSNIFVMTIKLIQKIRDQFSSIFNEMTNNACVR